MINKRDAEEVISKCLDTDRLRKIIRNTSIVAWKNEITDIEIDKWISNFRGYYFENIENERKLALWLLAHFSYYTYDDIRILCKNLFNMYLHEKLKDYDGDDLKRAISEIIDNTIFIGLGNDSESGNNILYYFRQENCLSKESFEIEQGKTYQNLVYIDDVTMSGEQASTYISSRKITAKNIYATMLIATEDAVRKLTVEDKRIKLISTMIFDEREKAFSESAYAFSEKRIADIRLFAKEFCKIYGRIAVDGCGYMTNYPLGFDDGQYMISFEYNTPDNTLPIFWGTGNGWNPLFKRYQKLYNGEEFTINDRKYY